jgi:hypothetical protein
MSAQADYAPPSFDPTQLSLQCTIANLYLIHRFPALLNLMPPKWPDSSLKSLIRHLPKQAQSRQLALQLNGLQPSCGIAQQVFRSDLL